MIKLIYTCEKCGYSLATMVDYHFWDRDEAVLSSIKRVNQQINEHEYNHKHCCCCCNCNN